MRFVGLEKSGPRYGQFWKATDAETRASSATDERGFNRIIVSRFGYEWLW